MAINLKLSELNDDNKVCVIHSVPGKIHFDGNAKISDYFRPETIQNGEYKASFRGYPLDGKKVILPDQYLGIVLKEDDKPALNIQPRNLHVSHQFQSLTYWNWNKKPSPNDPFLSALDWIDISEVVHSPLDEVDE